MRKLNKLPFPREHNKQCVPVAYANVFNDRAYMTKSEDAAGLTLADEIMLLHTVSDNCLSLDVIANDSQFGIKWENIRSHLDTVVNFQDRRPAVFVISDKTHSEHVFAFIYDGDTEGGVVVDSRNSHYLVMTIDDLLEVYSDIYRICIITAPDGEPLLFPRELFSHIYKKRIYT